MVSEIPRRFSSALWFSDSSEFRPALAVRDGIEIDHDMTLDGFYTVGEIIGCPIIQEGVINYPMTKLSLCRVRISETRIDQ